MSDPQSTKTRTTFRLECSVNATINATPERVWSLLTDVTNFLKWNSTLTSIEGSIAPGGEVKMTVPEAPGRVFKVKVSEYEANRRMVWRDGFAPMFQGVRTYTLEPAGAATRFTMSEVFSGLMLPMIAGQLPNFQPIFQRYAEDLKKAAEGA